MEGGGGGTGEYGGGGGGGGERISDSPGRRFWMSSRAI